MDWTRFKTLYTRKRSSARNIPFFVLFESSFLIDEDPFSLISLLPMKHEERDNV